MINRAAPYLIRKYNSLFKGTSLILTYVGWILIFRLLVLTFITYFVVSTSSQNARFDEINETLGAGELGIMGFSALIFVCLIPLLNPLTSTTFREIFSPERFEKKFLSGFAQGAVLACGVILAFLISGTYRYLGFFIHLEDTSFALGHVVFRALSIGVLIYCEEFLFRNKILRYFEVTLSRAQVNPMFSHLVNATLLSLLYCGVKTIQFDLGWMHLLTLFLISLSLSLRALISQDFTEGAGFWSAILILFHPLLSLPILGSDFSGLILVKYQALVKEETLSTTATLLRIFSGGQGGPLSAVALQLLFLLDVTRWVLRYKKVWYPQTLRKPVF